MTLSDVMDVMFYAVTGLFLVAALINLSGVPVVRATDRAASYPANFYRVVGAIEALVVLFLAVPQTRIWGVILGGLVVFFSTVTLLKNRQYAWSVPAMLVLAALAPASLLHG
jgi:hypothetical protein